MKSIKINNLYIENKSHIINITNVCKRYTFFMGHEKMYMIVQQSKLLDNIIKYN